MNEQQLIVRCQQNDYAAQLAVYNNYKNMLLNVSYRIVQSRVEAEDLMQEAFVLGFQKMHQLREDANLGAWLKRIVINKSLDAIRKQKKEVWLEESSIVETSEETEQIDENIQLSVGAIKDCIQQLKEKYRIVLMLYLLEDYTHREIGEALGIKESTVRNQYKRGKQQLATLLKQYQDEHKKVHTGA